MATLRRPDSSLGPFAERTTRKITTTVTDETGVAIPGGSLTAMTVTLYNEADLAIINGRDHANIVAQVDGSGVLGWVMDPADMAIVDDSLMLEAHRALFEWTWQGGAKAGRYEVQILVSNMAKVP